MTNVKELKAWLKQKDVELISALAGDIEKHVTKLLSKGEPFYGYAVLPGEYATQPDAATVHVAFNRESDIDPDNVGDIYYRYSVDEWKHRETKGFKASTSRLKASLKQFRTMHQKDEESYQLDEFEVAFVEKTNRSVLDALLQLKKKGLFDAKTFLIIWFSDSADEIVNESAKKLNARTVYKEFATEFD